MGAVRADLRHPNVAAVVDFALQVTTEGGQGGRPVSKLYRFARCAGAHIKQPDFFKMSGITDLLDYGLQGCVAGDVTLFSAVLNPATSATRRLCNRSRC